MQELHKRLYTVLAVISVPFRLIGLGRKNVLALYINNLRIYYISVLIMYLFTTAVTYYFLYFHGFPFRNTLVLPGRYPGTAFQRLARAFGILPATLPRVP